MAGGKWSHKKPVTKTKLWIKVFLSRHFPAGLTHLHRFVIFPCLFRYQLELYVKGNTRWPSRSLVRSDILFTLIIWIDLCVDGYLLNTSWTGCHWGYTTVSLYVFLTWKSKWHLQADELRRSAGSIRMMLCQGKVNCCACLQQLFCPNCIRSAGFVLMSLRCHFYVALSATGVQEWVSQKWVSENHTAIFMIQLFIKNKHVCRKEQQK